MASLGKEEVGECVHPDYVESLSYYLKNYSGLETAFVYLVTSKCGMLFVPGAAGLVLQKGDYSGLQVVLNRELESAGQIKINGNIYCELLYLKPGASQMFLPSILASLGPVGELASIRFSAEEGQVYVVSFQKDKTGASYLQLIDSDASLFREEIAELVRLVLSDALARHLGQDLFGLVPSWRAPLMVTDEDLNVVWKNKQVKDLSTDAFGIFSIDKKLNFVKDIEYSRVKAKLGECIRLGLPVYVSVGDGAMKYVFVAYPSHVYVKGRRVNAVILRLKNGREEPAFTPDQRYFLERWGFSERAARVGASLLSEDSLSQIAEELNLSYETVRWYLKQFCAQFQVAGRLGFVNFVYSDFLKIVV